MAKKNQKATVDIATREQVLRNNDTAPVYYANYLGMLGTKGDVRLRFGQVGDATEDKVDVNVLAHIYVSPDHLLDFVQLLVTKMQQYGTLFPDSAWERLLTHIQATGDNDKKAQAE